MSGLQDIEVDPTESSRGLLGYFPSVQMDSIKSPFATIREADPWGMVTYPLRATLLDQVKEA